MIRIERVPLPGGLRALAHRDPHGGLVIYVSSALDARKQRTAVMAALRASRRAGWRTAAPLGLALLLALRLGLRGGTTALHRGAGLGPRVRPVAWVAAGTAVAAGAVVTGLVFGAPPHPHHSSVPPAPSQTTQPSAGPGRHSGTVRPAAGNPTASAGALAGQPQAARHSLTSQSSAPVSGAPPSAPVHPPSPAPSASPSPSPSPMPSASPTPSGSPGTCVIVLGIRVCVPVSVPVSVSISAGV